MEDEMMDASRRGVLRLFGVTAAAAAVPVAVVTAEAAVCEATLDIPRDPFALPFSPPAGVTYQWRRLFITHDDPDMEHIVKLVMSGWKPVPLSRHREHYGTNAHPFSAYWIEIGGMVLMEKPTADIAAPESCPLPRQATGEEIA
jgi:hypothetical protein